MTINNEQDWWDLCERIWPDILEIFSNCGAELRSCEYPDGAYQEPYLHDISLGELLENLKREYNGKELSRWFNLAWLSAPDRPYIHSWPNWYNFCDLCSENWVFYENEEDYNK
jgi:hypothetical protein